VPTLRHVMELLMCPTDAMAAGLNTTVAELAAGREIGCPWAASPRGGRPRRHVRRPVHDESAVVRPGIVIDLSACSSRLRSLRSWCARAWLAQVVAAKDRQRIIVVDECWKAIRDAGFVAWGEETQKLSRAYGVQFVTIVQRISDLAAQADDGTATSKRAQGFVTEAETKVTFNLVAGSPSVARRHGLDRVRGPPRPETAESRALWRSANTGRSSRRSCLPATSPCATPTRRCGATVTGSWVRRLTWSKFGIAVSVGLIIFGALVAVLPRHQTSVPPTDVDSRWTTRARGGRRICPRVGGSAGAAQQVAEQFVTACDTTDRRTPRVTLLRRPNSPALRFPHIVTWPPA